MADNQPQVVANIEQKLQTALDLILMPSFIIQNDTYFHKLLTFLSNENEPGSVQSQIIIRWIQTALHQWEAQKVPNMRIGSFMLNLTAQVSKNETTFLTFSLANVYSRLFELFNLQNEDENVQPTIKLAYVRILLAFLEHNSGLEWILSNNIWKDCLNFCLEQQTIYIIKEGQNFIYQLIIKTVENHSAFCKLVIGEIYGKLQAVPSEADTMMSCFANPNLLGSRLDDKCANTLRLVIFILNKLIEDKNEQEDYRAVNLMINDDDHKLENIIKDLKPRTNDVERVYELHSILIYIKVLNILMLGKSAEYEVYYTTGTEIMAFFHDLLCVRYIPVVIRLAHLSDSLWNYCPEVKALPLPSNPEHRRREPLRFQNQLLVFEVTAIFGICFLHTNIRFDETDDLREEFISSFFRILHEDTIRLGYNWRQILDQQTEGFQMAKFTMSHILSSIDHFGKSRAIIVFQVLVYMVKDILQGLKEKPSLTTVFVQEERFMIGLFETMAAFIKKYEICWSDSVETICVMQSAIECINQPFWPPRVIVHALKLVDLSIVKFLPPDLALLVEEDSTTTTLGSMLTMKLYDMHWEIRDSILEILHTIATISNSKYPLFQTMLLNVNIVPMIVTMAVNDSEPFVRAAAIKCLQEMIQIHEIWTKVLVSQQLPQKMMHILKFESEGIVRTQAAKLMASIHEYQSFPNDLMPEIYESMAIAAVKDLHWEVKTNALDFWGKVVLNHLQEQGYIDHKFPNVTFSKEQRKIVMLTEEEVQRRLKKVLSQLSTIGCLGVLHYAIEEDCDLEVSKKSLVKLNKMKNVLQTYKMFEYYQPLLPDHLKKNDAAAPPAEAVKVMPATSSECDLDLTQETLESILNINDMGLLKNFINTDDMPRPIYPDLSLGVVKQLQAITPEVFITYIQNDLDELVNGRSTWLNKLDNFESLLDDMTKCYENDVNTMDCY